MISKEHHKHPKIAKAATGRFHKNEWSILGTDCNTIQSISDTLSLSLNNYKAIYIDADHDNEAAQFYHSKDGKLTLDCNFHLLNEEYGIQLQCNEADFVMVNGNHYRADKQIVVIDKEKEASLLRRISDCNSIEMILVKNKTALFPFVKKILDDSTVDIPIFDLDDVKSYTEYFTKVFEERKPPLMAFILAGGESKRMGKDKSQLNYHGVPQEQFMANLVNEMGIKTFVSKEENYEGRQAFPIIRDRLIGMGPFGAICSAMMHNPNTAWLVIACDLPFLSKDLINTLIEHRDCSKYATAFKAKTKDFAEPLITIYEPKAYQRFLEFMSKGVSCPRKVLINSDIKIIELDDERPIKNINTPEEFKVAQNEIGNESK